MINLKYNLFFLSLLSLSAIGQNVKPLEEINTELSRIQIEEYLKKPSKSRITGNLFLPFIPGLVDPFKCDENLPV